MTDKVPKFDTTSFKTNSYVRRIEKPWGYELHFVPADFPYMGKLIHINRGARLSLQIHDEKIESWILIKGKAMAEREDSSEKMVKTELRHALGYSISLGQKHRLVAITDCDIIEVSTPEKGTTWRLEDDYSRPDETPSQRKIERA